MANTLPAVVTKGRLPFLIFVGIFLGLGSLVSGLNYILLGTSLPAATLVATVASLVPLAILLWYFRWLDASEAESRFHFYLAFAWGALGATGWALIVNSLGVEAVGETAGVVTIAPLSEEIFKGMFLLALYLWRRAHFDGVLDGIVYAGFIGTGFAFVENITYFAAAYSGTDVVTEAAEAGGPASLIVTFVARGFFSPFAHPLFTAAFGVALGLALARRAFLLRFLLGLIGLICAVVLHSVWNAALTIMPVEYTAGVYFFFFVPLFAAYITYGLRQAAKTRAAQASAFQELSRFGMIPAYSAQWLSSPRVRREVVKSARRHLPTSSARAVRSYQYEAVRFAHFHLRVRAGLGPQDPRPEAYGYAQRLAALAAQFPPPPPALVFSH